MDQNNSSSAVSNLVPPVKNLGPISKLSKFSLPLIAVGLVVVLAGVGTGWVLSKGGSSSMGTKAPGAKSGPNEAGFADEKNFKDTAEGILEEGGISGEGTHHLTREGGPSQTVYLTSTVIDLQGFVGKKVQVWGETTKGRKAGWLMDVGKVKTLE